MVISSLPEWFQKVAAHNALERITQEGWHAEVLSRFLMEECGYRRSAYVPQTTLMCLDHLEFMWSDIPNISSEDYHNFLVEKESSSLLECDQRKVVKHSVFVRFKDPAMDAAFVETVWNAYLRLHSHVDADRLVGQLGDKPSAKMVSAGAFYRVADIERKFPTTQGWISQLPGVGQALDEKLLATFEMVLCIRRWLQLPHSHRSGPVDISLLTPHLPEFEIAWKGCWRVSNGIVLAAPTGTRERVFQCLQFLAELPGTLDDKPEARAASFASKVLRQWGHSQLTQDSKDRNVWILGPFKNFPLFYDMLK
jgi:hypothetical protein